MADQWYYTHDDEKTGPFSSRQLKELADSGGILPTDFVWKEGIIRGVLAEKVKHLFAPTAVVVATSNGPGTLAKATCPPKPELVTAPLGNSTSAGPSHALSLSGQVPNGFSASKTTNEPPAGEATALAKSELPPISDKLELRYFEEETAAPPPSWQKPAGRGRATAVRGAIIVGQDGTNVQFRKKCSTCGHEDNCRSRMPIKTGVTKVGFYCPKCRKRRDVEILGFAR